MATPVKLKLIPRSTLKAKNITYLVGQVQAGDGIVVTKTGGNFTVATDPTAFQPNDADLTGLAAITGIGMVTRTSANTYTTRTLTGTTSEITITNGSGAAGAPTVALADKLDVQRTSTEVVTVKPSDFGAFYHRISIPSDGKDVTGLATGNQIATGLLVEQYPNNGAKGFRNGLTAACWVPPGSTVNTTGDYGYCGGLLFGKTDVTLGGTNTGAGAKGSVFGGNSFATAGASGTNLYGVVAHEADVLTLAGSTMKIRIGYSSVDFGSGAGTQGATCDAAFSAGATAGSVKWKNAFLISDINGGNPIATTGKLFATQNSATVAYGVDISSYTFSTAAFNSTGFSVDGSGNIAGKTTTLTSIAQGALAVGRQGAANPAFAVDASATSQAAGVLVTGVAAGNTPGISVVSSGNNEGLLIDAKGSGTVTLGLVSTGAITLNRATTIGAALTYGGVTLSNAVTGTGNMVLSAAPTLTGTTNVAALAASGTISSTKTATVGAAVDTSGITSQTGITDGSSSSVIITGACAIVTITESTAFDVGVYLVGAGTAQTLLGQTGTKFVSPTTGPLAGHVSFSYDGSTGNRVYNKLGSTADFKVAVWKLN